MQVSTRLVYPEVGPVRSRPSTSRVWTGDPGSAVRREERGSGDRRTLARGSHQQVNEGAAATEWADKEVFVARTLRSTLAMLQMHAGAQAEPREAAPIDPDADRVAALVNRLFADVLASRDS